MQPAAKGNGSLDSIAGSGYLREMPARMPTAPLFGLLIFAAWLVPALLSGFNTYMQARLGGRSPDWHWMLFNSIDWLLYALLTPFVFRASRRLPLERPHLLRNISLHVLGALAMCVAWAALGTLLRLEIFSHQQNATALKVWVDFVSWVFITLPFGVGVYFALVGIQHSFLYFAKARERETQAARLAAQLSEARLGALRMQLNPHFLFNSLNAITVLVRDQDTAAASRTLELLSDLLRQVLRTDESHETTLSRELEFLQRYLAIEQVRFSDRLRPRIEINPAVARAAVPRFLLQPLVENALRHGIARRAEAGCVEVTADREDDQLVLTVCDDGPGLSATPDTESGVGLSNTRARLSALYDAHATLQVGNAKGGGVIATVRLPYHEAEDGG
ncbi:MAG TPA: histidine kinase [Bryobacteraceae bacterium]|nr:histidine kinase [Bryobacteraceae bacterium]